MTAFNIITLVIGIGLLLLGSVSGVALFKNAIKPSEKVDIGLGTLWSLFITGLSFGILLAWWALP